MSATGDDGVALTFDDGPDPMYTPQMLDLLKKQRVKATFCLVGFRAAKYPAWSRRIVAEGHTLCNHTWHAPDGPRQADGRGDPQGSQDTNNAIRRAVPARRSSTSGRRAGSSTPAWLASPSRSA